MTNPKTIGELKTALDDAEARKESLVAERREKRESLTKADFRAYNEETRAFQIEVEQAITNAQKALTEALNDVRANALNATVGTINEKESTGGSNG